MFHISARRFLAGIALAGSTALAQAAFKDPLTTPAMQTQLLAQAPMTAVVRAGPNRIVAAGWRGVIAVSTDDGKTWQQASVPVREDFTALAFPTPMHGWAAGNDGILLETTDGGMHWTKRLDGNIAARVMLDAYSALVAKNPADAIAAAALKDAQDYQAQAPARPFLDVAFQTEQVGYVAGTYGMLFRTEDAGKTWTPLTDRVDNPNGYNIYAIHIQGNEVYLAGELGLALRLDPASGRFVKLTTSYDGSFFALAGNSTVLLAAGLRGNAFLSSNAGATWKRVEFGASSPATFSGATLLPDGGIVLVTLAGQIFRSQDQGRTFAMLAARSPMRYSAVAPAGRDEVVVVGSQGIRIEAIK